jgi:hypothetical protein
VFISERRKGYGLSMAGGDRQHGGMMVELPFITSIVGDLTGKGFLASNIAGKEPSDEILRIAGQIGRVDAISYYSHFFQPFGPVRLYYLIVIAVGRRSVYFEHQHLEFAPSSDGLAMKP